MPENIIAKWSAPYLELLRVNMNAILRTTALPEIKEAFLEVYDRLASSEEAEAGAAIKGKDPLSLVNLRPVFVNQLNRDLASAEIVDGELAVSVLDRSLLGYAGATPTGSVDTVDILAFYIEGMIEEHAFITPEQYTKGRAGASRGNSGGRVGGGFMMTRRNYEREGWEKITGVPFAQVRHPISDQKPFKDFSEISQNLNYSKWIDMALKQTDADFGLR
jgi:hypothetical protein